MKQFKTKIRGKEVTLKYPMAKKEIENQIEEIFNQEHYKAGRVKDGVYLDLGANVGMASLYFADIAKKIYAIEPYDVACEAMKHNLRHCKNVEIHNYAVAVFNGKTRLFATTHSTPQTIFPNINTVSNIVVPAIRLDTFFEENKIDHVDVMKIDVEGSEFAIFPDDSFKNVADKIDLIVGEAHYLNEGFAEVIPFILKEYGYKTEFVKHSPPNLLRVFIHNNAKNKKRKNYEIAFNTIFVARRKK